MTDAKPAFAVDLWIQNSSGLTRPFTTDSPSPQDPSTTTTPRKPLSVSSVNIVPAHPRSLRTIRWMPTESATLRCSNPFCTRYAMARSVKSDAMQRRMAASSASGPRTCR